MSDAGPISGGLQAAFWLALAVIACTYAGYPAFIGLLARLRPRPVRRGDITPSVTVLVPACNEAEGIAARLENILSLDYDGRCDILMIADGSTDRTVEIASAYAGYSPERPVHILSRPGRRSKVDAIARALPDVEGDIILLTNACHTLAPDLLRRMIPYFADDEVGAVSGETRTPRPLSPPRRYASLLKTWDAAVSSVMGVSDEVWAVRRSVYVPPESDVLPGDLVASLRLVERGWRVAYEPKAVAIEATPPKSLKDEWERRVWNATGRWQAIGRLSGMLRHPQLIITLQYLGRHLLPLISPALFGLLLLANVGLVLHPATAGHLTYRVALVIQGIGYALAGLGWALAAGGYDRVPGALRVPFDLALSGVATVAGGWRHVRRRRINKKA
ncbi:MAG: glycosyltransferase [Anaerolineae bacterium]|jgi:biofilm PGA synthesis N-glycosyltransferase PgaC